MPCFQVPRLMAATCLVAGLGSKEEQLPVWEGRGRALQGALQELLHPDVSASGHMGPWDSAEN